MKRTSAAVRYIFQGIFLICIAVLLWQLVVYLFTELNYIPVWVGFGVAICVMVGVILFFRRFSIPHFTLWLFVVGILIRLGIVFLLHPPVVSDFQLLFDAAQGLLSGDTSFQNTEYFSLWAYQTPFVLWEALWLSIWNNPLCIKLVHVVLASGTVCLFYRLISTHEYIYIYIRGNAAQAAAVCTLLLPSVMTLPTVLTNQIPSAFFLMLGIWLLVCPDSKRLKVWRWPLAGLTIQIGNLFRAEGILVLVALLAYFLFLLFQNPKLWKRILAGLCVFFIVYFGVHGLAGSAVKLAGINQNGVENGFSEWKFVTGFNPETKGRYSGEDWKLLEGTLDETYRPTETTRQTARGLIFERVSVPGGELMQFLGQKIQQQWCSDSLNWPMEHIREHTYGSLKISGLDIYRLAQGIDRGIFFSAILLCLIWLVFRWRDIIREPAEKWIPAFVFFAGFCAFLAIEVQPRYSYFPLFFLIGCAAYGMDVFYRGRGTTSAEESGILEKSLIL